MATSSRPSSPPPASPAPRKLVSPPQDNPSASKRRREKTAQSGDGVELYDRPYAVAVHSGQTTGLLRRNQTLALPKTPTASRPLLLPSPQVGRNGEPNSRSPQPLARRLFPHSPAYAAPGLASSSVGDVFVVAAPVATPKDLVAPSANKSVEAAYQQILEAANYLRTARFSPQDAAIAALREENERLVQERDAHAQQSVEATERLETLQAENDALRGERDAEARRATEAVRRLQDLKEENDALQKECDADRAGIQLQQLTQEKESLREECDAKVAALMKTIAEGKTNLNGLSESYVDLKKCYHDVCGQLADVTKDRDATLGQLAVLHSRLVALDAAYQRLDQQLRDACAADDDDEDSTDRRLVARPRPSIPSMSSLQPMAAQGSLVAVAQSQPPMEVELGIIHYSAGAPMQQQPTQNVPFKSDMAGCPRQLGDDMEDVLQPVSFLTHVVPPTAPVPPTTDIATSQQSDAFDAFLAEDESEGDDDGDQDPSGSRNDAFAAEDNEGACTDEIEGDDAPESGDEEEDEGEAEAESNVEDEDDDGVDLDAFFDNAADAAAAGGGDEEDDTTSDEDGDESDDDARIVSLDAPKDRESLLKEVATARAAPRSPLYDQLRPVQTSHGFYSDGSLKDAGIITRPIVFANGNVLWDASGQRLYGLWFMPEHCYRAGVDPEGEDGWSPHPGDTLIGKAVHVFAAAAGANAKEEHPVVYAGLYGVSDLPRISTVPVPGDIAKTTIYREMGLGVGAAPTLSLTTSTTWDFQGAVATDGARLRIPTYRKALERYPTDQPAVKVYGLRFAGYDNDLRSKLEERFAKGLHHFP
ncbi:hypothetical protein MKEN_01101400 [Mycena kentingensis (nom. inval.)]|nr:hypothetical protein MKEN_01101400 [Mycena kentingensis (nom. inval.)]